ncbi:MAG: NAD(P)H-binding protein, partial [Flavobacteriales bacterium]|nr:NAD(P)H-binding protein [Flavobacteriales bacterium]
MNILITGATGNVGMSVLKHLTTQNNNLKVFAGVRNIEKEKDKLQEFNVSLVTFDFENVPSFRPALKGIDILFLLRPPQLADVEKYFKPLIDEVVKCDVKQIVFLSVQGVENSK